MEYIKASAKKNGGSANICGGKKPKKCIFCKSIKYKHKNYVILKNRYSFAVLNIFPYNNGHVMVSPIRHTGELSQLNNNEILDLFQTLNKTKKMLDKVLKPHGYNIGLNTSASAGAGESGHLHIHIVPRWRGDTNFMTTLYDTKIISQSLDELYKQLREAQTYGTK
ncbi:MAG: HIT domain-containing protein [Candidatus Omnitrophota bacterium]|nr:HIT domain-containing protein [Candidatus Omnitrophota bacterium]